MAFDDDVEIHWLSIVNSFVLVLLLTAFLAFILLRVLKNDFARYLDVDEEDVDGSLEESGWKLIRGDVFRPPSYPMLFSSCIGTGVQLLVIFCSIVLLAVVGMFYHGNRGTLYTVGIILYALTACMFLLYRFQ